MHTSMHGLIVTASRVQSTKLAAAAHFQLRIADNSTTPTSSRGCSLPDSVNFSSFLIVLNVLFKVLILLTLDFNHIFICLMWATVSALLCLVVRFCCYFIHVYFLLVL